MKLASEYCHCHHEERAYYLGRESTVMSAWLENYRTETQ